MYSIPILWFDKKFKSIENTNNQYHFESIENTNSIEYSYPVDTISQISVLDGALTLPAGVTVCVPESSHSS